MDPKILAIILFHLFFERVFLNKESFFSILFFTKFLSFQQNSNKAKIKLHEQSTWAFGRVHKVHFWNATYASFACCANLLFEVLLSLALSPAWTWGFYPTNLKSFLQRFVQKDMHPKFMVVLLQSSLTIILTPCLILIKEGYLT